MVCAHCGAVSDPGQRFCYNCGSRLDAQPTAASQPTVTLPTAAPPQTEQPPPPVYQPLGQPVGAPPLQPATYAVPNSNLAIISLVSGIITWVLFPVIAAIIAVITGHMARREIRQSGGRLAGEGLATIGLVLGYAQIALLILGLCAGLAFFALAIVAA